MSQTTTVYCDICKITEGVQRDHPVPVVFTTEQTEGRSVAPYFTYEKLDLCRNCEDRIIREQPLWGQGAQGHNTYHWRT